MTLDDVIIHHTSRMSWDTGGAVLELMAPSFRENLGPTDSHYDKFYQINLWMDPESGRRSDLIKMDPGYLDASMGYHDCAEECYALEGQCDLWGEGQLEPGEYFWRPPGWVHSAGSVPGFVALLFLESGREDDGSGPVSRVVRPDNEGGHNALVDDDSEEAMGPRGFVKRAFSQQLPWIPGESYARMEGVLDGFDLPRTRFKILSKNFQSGAQSLLIELQPGYRQAFAGVLSERTQLFVVKGAAQLGDTALEQGSYVCAPGGASTGVLSSSTGAVLFAKVDGWLDFRPGAGSAR